MELKWHNYQRWPLVAYRSNRTFMELKLGTYDKKHKENLAF